MLKGLEVSEVRLSEIQQGKNFRIDSDYYEKEYLSLESKLDKYGTKNIFEICKQITDFGAFSQTNFVEFLDEGILFLRNQDVKESYINFNNNVFISEEVYNRLTLHLQENDIVIPRVGTLGNAALITKEMLPCTANQNLAVIRLKEFNSYAVIMTLVSKVGKFQINRTSTGNVQQWLNLEAIGTLRIPSFSPDFQSEIEQFVKSAHSKLAESKSLYAEAEEILLSELRLKDWQQGKNSHTDSILLTQNQDEDTKTKRDSVGISNPCDSSNPCGNIANYSIKRFSDFASSGRLDAEYYQPKYDSLFEHLAKYKCTKLGDIVTIKKSVEPGSESYIEKGIPFIRVSDVNKFEIAETDLHLSPKDFNLELLKPHKNTILFSKDGSIGIAYKCEEDLNVITSGALLHLDICNKEVLPDYLTLVLNSVVVQLQAERDSNGAIIQHWKPDDIKKVLIPLLPESIQALIAEKIQKSFDLRKESKELLESAKRMVEEEIEK